jgi:hypothetical protein
MRLGSAYSGTRDQGSIPNIEEIIIQYIAKVR